MEPRVHAFRQPWRIVSPCLADGVLTLALCRSQVRRIARHGDVLVCLTGPRSEPRLRWTAVVDFISNRADYARLCQSQLPSHLHSSDSMLGDCIWTPDGRRRAVPVERRAEQLAAGEKVDRVLVCRRWTFYGARGPAATRGVPEPYRGVTHPVAEPVFFADLKQLGPLEDTGDASLPPRFEDIYVGLPLVGLDDQGAVDGHGVRLFFPLSSRLSAGPWRGRTGVAVMAELRWRYGLAFSGSWAVLRGPGTFHLRRTCLITLAGSARWWHLVRLDGREVDVLGRFALTRAGQELTLQPGFSYLVLATRLPQVLRCRLADLPPLVPGIPKPVQRAASRFGLEDDQSSIVK